MERIIKETALFKFHYLPDYAKFLLNNKLEEFTMVSIRFCRELDLPMIRPTAQLPECKLIELSIEADRESLTALAENNIERIISKNIYNCVQNRIEHFEDNKLLDNTQIAAEDFILGFYLRRKVFSFFLHSYTQNAVVHMLIAAEVDYYCTQEHLLTTRAYLGSLKNQRYTGVPGRI